MIDGVSIREPSAMLSLSARFEIPAAETGLDAPLWIDLQSALFGGVCTVRHGAAMVSPVAVEYGKWRDDAGGWPPASLSGAGAGAEPA